MSILIIFFKTDQKKTTQIFLVTISALFLFSIFDDTKSYKKIPYFESDKKEKKTETTLVLIWDEMSGLNSLSSKTKEGQVVDDNFKKLFEKYNFDYYSNAFTISDGSTSSLTTLLNFKQDFDNLNSYVVKSNEYFSEYEIKQNLFFNNFDSISVIQNIHINYCNNSSVSKCYQYNPLNLKLLNTDIDSFSKIISSWSLNGSIIGKFTWRILKQLNLIQSTLEPEGEKLFIRQILDYIQTDLISKKFDLVFAHLLVPHKPYGFNSNCEYNVKLSNLNKYLKKRKYQTTQY